MEVGIQRLGVSKFSAPPSKLFFVLSPFPRGTLEETLFIQRNDMNPAWKLNQLLGLFLESPCPLCQRSQAQALCVSCQRQIQRYRCSSADAWQLGSLSVFAWGGYSGALKRAIAALKYEGNPHLAEILGTWMAESWRSVNPSTNGVVVPIPMHPSKKRQRGFNQAELLAQHFCHITQLPIAVNGLKRDRATEAQFKLSSAEREHNLAEAFSVGKPFLQKPPSRPVWLLDDIYTTGATASSAAQTLRQHGIRVQGIIVLARTEAGMKSGKCEEAF
ncbi:ComF family protein [Leptolyngbya sp. Cla-17]|uniref:ComF family protein n=1 Tax=Leptolyngbya sp. Cla-17 TaxID=2803751 RepID=UPI001F5E11BF|nr:ComF family protein [Leptolyngbya sp. Cla-17]